MGKPFFNSYSVEDRSYVSFLKREIHNLVKAKFSERRTGEIDIIVSELCSNLVKHAFRGEILYRLSEEDGETLFEIISIDNGPGIEDLQHSRKDGVSTTNTLGQGIGSITRLSNFAQFYTQDNWGTIVYCRIFRNHDYTPSKEAFLCRCLIVPKPGEHVSGDGVNFFSRNGKLFIFTGDGLGHGIHANEAVELASEVFLRTVETEPSAIVREMHEQVKKTRGLVGTVAVLDQSAAGWSLCGVGNIYARMQRGLEYKNYVSNNGIIGHNIPTRLQDSGIGLEKFQQLILCSDGIRTRWDLVKYPGILKYDPMILAACLYKDHGRKTDDMTIFIVKIV